jgi:hypothetical protein
VKIVTSLARKGESQWRVRRPSDLTELARDVRAVRVADGSSFDDANEPCEEERDEHGTRRAVTLAQPTKSKH